jgi:predicted homoserine dehydrogenase-like protein
VLNLSQLLAQRLAEDRPIRVGLIGAGKFGSMFLAQARLTPGLHVLGIADLSVKRARDSLRLTGWPSEQIAGSRHDALATGRSYITDDAEALITWDNVEVVVEATGNPVSAINHALLCCRYRRHIVMVTVEADALVGPMLARRATEAGIVYSLAYGDQPSLICELVDWARAIGLAVVCAGKGTKYLPEYHASTPETVWDYYGFSQDDVARGDFNPKTFNSFLDGTKSAIEMAAVANATGLLPARAGLGFPPAGALDLAQVCRPRTAGGELDSSGSVEVVSSLHRDGRPVVQDLRWGVFVTFETGLEYVKDCFAQYGLATDDSGQYAALYRPYHLIGLELGISVASVALRREPTGMPTGFRGDVVATAKRDLVAGETLDGEGGYTVYGRLMRAEDSLALDGLPIGLAHDATLSRSIDAGQVIRWSDVNMDTNREAVRIRREMEAAFRQESPAQT